MRAWDQMVEHKMRFLKTCCLYSTNLMVGVMAGIVGPTLLDLRQQTNSDLKTMAYILTCRSAAHAVGSAILGSIYDRVNFQLVIVACMIWTAIFTLAIPHIGSAYLLIAVFAMDHLALGGAEAGCNLFLRHIWGQESAPFLQLLALMFGTGCLLASLVAVPFLVESEDFSHTNVTSSGTEAELMLIYPYSIIAFLMLLTALFTLTVYKISPVTTIHPSRAQDENLLTPGTSAPSYGTVGQKDQRNDRRERNSYYGRWKGLVVCLTLLFFAIYMGLEVSMGSFLTTFAVKSNLHLKKAEGVRITTVYWTTFTLFRLLTAFYIEFTGPEVNITGSLVLVLVANGAFVFPFGDTSETMLVIGSALIGTGLSSVFACLFSFLEQFFLLSPRVSSFTIIAAMVGEFVFPAIFSFYIETFPDILLWITFSSSALMLLLFALMSIICHKKLGKLVISDLL